MTSKQTAGAIAAANEIDNKYYLSVQNLNRRQDSGEEITPDLEQAVYEQYENEIAAIIDKHIATSPTACQHNELLAPLKRLLDQFKKWEGYHDWTEEDENAADTAQAAIAKHAKEGKG